MSSRTIVFIHGMYMTSLCWEGWIKNYEDRGYKCVAPNWPGREGSVETLRSMHPDAELGTLTLTKIIDYFTNIIRMQQEKPMLIGHSMGGLVVQLLLQKDLAVAGVAIDSAPPRGVFTAKWSFLKSNWPHITPFVSQNSPISMTFERFQYTFVNALPLAEQQAAYERYVVPESRQVPRQSLTAGIDFKRPHAPLLLIAGSADHLIPASLVKTNADRYAHSPSETGFKEFPGRTHFIIGQKNWEEVAEYVFSWLDQKGVAG